MRDMLHPNVKENVYMILHTERGIVLSYKTYQGNTKKAMFSRLERCQQAFKRYFKDEIKHKYILVKLNKDLTFTEMSKE